MWSRHTIKRCLFCKSALLRREFETGATCLKCRTAGPKVTRVA